MTTYRFVSGDTGSKLEVTCKSDATGAAIPLSGCTVAVRWRDATNLLVTRSMTVTNASAGIAEYLFTASELIAPKMSFEIRITDGVGRVQRSLNLIDVDVREALA